MSIKKELFGAAGLSLLVVGFQLPAQAQTTVIPAESVTDVNITDDFAIAELTFDEPQTQVWEQADSLSNSSVLATESLNAELATPSEEVIAVEHSYLGATQPITEASALTFPAGEAPEELAQIRRRRTRGGAASGDNFIGIGADFGYADDVSFAAISKFSFSPQWAVRPSVLIGDDFSVLVPVTYDFSRFSTGVGNFQVKPYAGAGAAFSDGDDDDDDSDFNLLLSAGVDVPVSQRFTFNAQVNWGVLNDSDFGATVGIGYNLGNIFQ
ncbi:MAG: hypothetical protein AAGB19_11515 [Cyanobacteria bacterium P01_F01_bin.3]